MFTKFLRCQGETDTNFSFFLLLSLSQSVSIQLWLKCALSNHQFICALVKTDKSLRRCYQVGTVRTIMDVWQFQDTEVWQSWRIVAQHSRALVQVWKNEQILLNLIICISINKSPLLFFLRWHIHLHIYVQNVFPGLLLQFLPDTHVISLRYFWVQFLFTNELVLICVGLYSLHRKSKGLWNKWLGSTSFISTYGFDVQLVMVTQVFWYFVIHICK